jgi:type IV secretory pathway VirB4 component
MLGDSASTEKFVSIETIRDDCVILKDGSLRAVVMVSGINFDLLSESEQDVIINAYQNLLNGLDFTLQTLVHSRKININNYLKKIKKRETQETNNLLRLQIGEYYNFIDELVKTSNIMVKRFYLIIPYSAMPTEIATMSGPLSQVFQKIPFGKKETPKQLEQKEEMDFINQKLQLSHRVSAVITGLKPMGLNAIRLKTPELVELYYNFYNPEKQERTNLTIASELEDLYSEEDNNF